ncbi:hypothetical protein H0A61_00006 [Koleobacter methoxysyntrophicus]|jgi:hypothetical protein|uniref:Uncharacterized protein n=1 Tax=Koleobacter methoxysyntrophicus TaxID=2751313 RepID=A0A8A0RJ73_9FIRM|nr:hypothetical protein [Koleobacter methoxysyntrophicus]QSQ07690.1 hypothetical protein H0A61_00006 [Koleobacter methoxysyntrophicus]
MMLEGISFLLIAVCIAVNIAKGLAMFEVYREKLYSSAMNKPLLEDYVAPSMIPDIVFYVPVLIIMVILIISMVSGSRKEKQF